MKHIQDAISSELGLMLIRTTGKEGEGDYRIAELYMEAGQYAAAFGFFIRATASPNLNLRYNAIIKACHCMVVMGDRLKSAETLALQAISLSPNAPEGYFHLSLVYQKQGNVQCGYAIATVGALLQDSGPNEELYYPGKYALLFQKAYHAWWVGRFEEARMIFQELKLHRGEMTIEYQNLVQENLSRLGSTADTFRMYTKSMIDRLKVKFIGVDQVEQNYSQTFQDMFVLSMLNGKRFGTFLEIGCADPKHGNNTALLEEFGWTGVSIDIKPDEIEKYQVSGRKCKAICADATEINYDQLIRDNFGAVVDYLQIDCEPPSRTYQILTMLPFDKVKFAVITFEHDYFCDLTGAIKDLSRNFLWERGYQLIVPDVAPDHRGSYEDWWVMPDLVDNNHIKLLGKRFDVVNCVTDVMLIP